MSVFSDPLVWGAFASIALGVSILLLWGRDPKADVHTVDDYRPELVNPPYEPRRRWSDVKPMILGPGVTYTPLDPLLCPIDSLPDAGAPIWEQMTAARFLRELGEEARAGLPPRSTDVRDLVGAFPVVAVPS